MGILIAALLALGLSALDFVPALGLAPARHAALSVLLIYLAVRGYTLTRGAPPAVLPAAPETPAPAPQPETAPTPARADIAPSGEALILLSLLQEKGRFLDFLSEDITSFKDAQVAAASRVVHQGCAAVIRECLTLAPAHAGQEGDAITIPDAADPHTFRLLGKIDGQAPYRGVVVHRGWKTTHLALPRSTRPVDPNGENILAPVEVEIR